MITSIRVLLLLLMVGLVSCGKPEDEQLIRQNLSQMAEEVEKRQPKKVVSLLTEDFLAQQQMGPEQVRQFMIAQFFRNQKINIVITGVKVKVSGQSADVKFRAVVSGSLSWIPERLDYYQVDTSWLKQEGDWLLQRADWQPVLATG